MKSLGLRYSPPGGDTWALLVPHNVVRRLAEDPESLVRSLAYDLLPAYHDPRDVRLLVAGLRGGSYNSMCSAEAALSTWGLAAVRGALAELQANDPDPQIRTLAADRLRALGVVLPSPETQRPKRTPE